MGRPPAIATLGELLVEFVREGRGGGHGEGGVYAGPFPSGAPAIFIDQAARAGARTAIAGAVGRDAFGAVVLGRLEAAGVDVSLVERDPALPTGIAFVSYDAAGAREFVYTIAASAAPRFPHGHGVAAAFLRMGVGVVHVTGSSLGDGGMRARILATLDALEGRGVRLSFDPNLRPELMAEAAAGEAVRRLLGRAAFVLPSEADAAALFPHEPFEVWAPRLLGQGAEAVAFKRGAAGASLWVRGAAGPVHAPPLPVREADPTGAGDCFGGTLVARLILGDAPEEALRLAAAAGALAVTRVGPMEGNSDLDALRRAAAGA